MEGCFGWGWVVDLKFVFHSLKPINTHIKYFLLKVEISNPGVLKESIATLINLKGQTNRYFYCSCCITLEVEKQKYRVIHGEQLH